MPATSEDSEMTIRIGDAAAPFQLQAAGGKVHTLDDSDGHWLWLVLHRHLG